MQVSGALLGHPWFVETSVNRTAEGLNDDFSAFMRAVETPNVGREIREWVDGNLSNKAIYLVSATIPPSTLTLLCSSAFGYV
jgi:hypothetical protein